MEKLIVPIAAQALVVFNGKSFPKVNLASRLSYKYLKKGSDLQPNLDNMMVGQLDSYREKGVHLHWNIPSILKHGHINNLEGTHEQMIFPNVPNRWLIMRYQTNMQDDTMQYFIKKWLLKRDEIVAKKNSNWLE